MLDRLIRGRVWIPLLGVMLAGIVAMQVEVLKLGASMGRSLEANSTLSAQNATLQESVASLADDQRIEQLAASMGMVMPPPSAVGFLSPHGRGVEAKAAANIHQPNPGSFDYLTSGNGARGHTVRAWRPGTARACWDRARRVRRALDVERSDVEHSDVQHSDVEHDVEHADRRDHRHCHHGERRDDRNLDRPDHGRPDVDHLLADRRDPGPRVELQHHHLRQHRLRRHHL